MNQQIEELNAAMSEEGFQNAIEQCAEGTRMLHQKDLIDMFEQGGIYPAYAVIALLNYAAFICHSAVANGDSEVFKSVFALAQETSQTFVDTMLAERVANAQQ